MKGGESMDLKDFFNIVRNRIRLILFITLLITLAVGTISSFVIRPTYKADISVIIGNSKEGNSTAGQNYDDVMMYQKMVKTYSSLAKSRFVAEDVIQNLKLEPMKASELLAMITATPDNETQFLTITVLSKEPQQAMNIANQVAKSLKDVSVKVNKVDIVEIIDEAQLPIEPDSPKPVRNTVMAFFISIMFSIGLVIILDYLDNTIKTKEDVEKLLELPVIGMVSLMDIKGKDVIKL
jgi:capsular polysaccharide biosynthesis protein